MSTENYLVTLRPLEPWFFGSEKWSELGNRTDFYQRSTTFPQQTALLGMLRHLLLLRHGLIGEDGKLTDKSKAATLIGSQSFDIYQNHQFGRIHALSPVFVLHKEEAYYPAALDNGLTFMCDSEGGRVSYGRGDHLAFLPYATAYDGKEGVQKSLVSASGAKLSFDQVFAKRTQPGITKNRTGKKLTGAYYRQEYQAFQPDFQQAAFGLYAQIDDDLHGWSDLMLMGGQKSPFVISFARMARPVFEEIPLRQQPQCPPWHCLTLLSDALVSGDILSGTVFAVNDSRSFRNIRAEVATTGRYNNLKRHPLENAPADQPMLSGRYALHARGSVFYYADEGALSKAMNLLQSAPQFHKIGYNYFIIERRK